MRRMEHIRTAIAVLLLSVVLPITLVLPFHHHQTEVPDPCELCTTHQSHPGHLQTDSQMDNCLICHFLGVTYLPEESVDAPSQPDGNTAFIADSSASVPSFQAPNLSTRAPPYSFC